MVDKFTGQNFGSPQRGKGLRHRGFKFYGLLRWVAGLFPPTQEISHLHLQRLRIPLRTSQPLQTNNPATQAGNPEELNPQNKIVETADFIQGTLCEHK